MMARNRSAPSVASLPATTVDEHRDLAWRLSTDTPAGAAAAILAVLQMEETLAVDNRLAPYADLLVPAFTVTPAGRLAAALDCLSASVVCRALFGGFRTLPFAVAVEVFDAASPPFIGRLIDEMAVGPDLPLRAARLLAAVEAGKGAQSLLASDVLAASRIGSLLPPPRLAMLLATVNLDMAADWLLRSLAVASPGEATELLDVVPLLLPATRRIFLETLAHAPFAHFPQEPPVKVDELDGCGDGGGTGPALETQSGHTRRARLWQMAPGQAAGVLSALAERRPRLAGDLLGSLTDLVLVRDTTGTLRKQVYRSRGTAVLDCLDPADPAVSNLLTQVDHRLLVVMLSQGDRQARLRLAPTLSNCAWEPGLATYPAVKATGVRRSRTLGRSVRWVQLTETVTVEGRQQPLLVDLAEIDLRGVHMRACGAPTPAEGVDLADFGNRLGPMRRGNSSPGDAFFRQLGVVRLAESVAERRALVGINGGHYLDYGHYLDALDLGLDLIAQPGLHFGNLIGWFVSGGQEVSPPVFNRAALVITADGRAHVRRVAPTSVLLPNGRTLRWRSSPKPRDGDVVFFDHLAATITPAAPQRVDISVSGTTVVAIHPGGGTPVPLLGFVLSLPRAGAESLLGGLTVGDPIVIGNDFPRSLGSVEEAMACGPLLVRDGQVDLDFEVEGFGEKDSTVLPLSLTRAVGSLRAARSFVMLRSGGLVLGVVSGTLLGGGPPTASVGTTFGELAQLCVDLGAEHAMAFDGGGSSSLVAQVDGQPRLLNVPTGGADVPAGVERFVKSYWLALPPAGEPPAGDGVP